MYGITDVTRLKEALDLVDKYQTSVKNTILLDILSLKNTSNTLGKNVFVVSSSQLLNSWSPEYYNIESQTHRIVEQLDKYKDIRDLKRRIEKFLEEEKIPMGNYTIRINEIVLEKLKEVLKTLEEL